MRKREGRRKKGERVRCIDRQIHRIFVINGENYRPYKAETEKRVLRTVRESFGENSNVKNYWVYWIL